MIEETVKHRNILGHLSISGTGDFLMKCAAIVRSGQAMIAAYYSQVNQGLGR